MVVLIRLSSGGPSKGLQGDHEATAHQWTVHVLLSISRIPISFYILGSMSDFLSLVLDNEPTASYTPGQSSITN